MEYYNNDLQLCDESKSKDRLIKRMMDAHRKKKRKEKVDDLKQRSGQDGKKISWPGLE